VRTLKHYITIEDVATNPQTGISTGANLIVLDYVHEVKISNSVDSMTDTAEIILPKKGSYTTRNANGITIDTNNLISGTNIIFKPNAKVTISLGYDYNDGAGAIMNQIFVGYIVGVIPSTQVTIYCEDAMSLLKQCKNPSYSIDTKINISLSIILQGLLPTWAFFGASIANASLLGYRVLPGASVAWELQRLQDCGFAFNWSNNKLSAGFRYGLNVTDDPLVKLLASKKTLKYEWNIISADEGIYRRPTLITTSVYAVTTKNKKTVIGPVIVDSLGVHYPITQPITKVYPGMLSFPDATGYQINGNIERWEPNFNLDINTLADLAVQRYLKVNYEGMTGDVETFLQPTISAPSILGLVSDKVPEKNGTYLVKEVNTYFGVNGGRQSISLERRLSA